MCWTVHIFMLVCFSPNTSGPYESLLLPWNIKCNCDFISDFFFLQLWIYSRNRMKSEFQYRSPNCEIKGHRYGFYGFILSWKQACIVTKGHVYCNVCWSQASATMGHIHVHPPPPTESNSIKFPIEFLHRGPYLLYCTLYKVMTHSSLDSMLPRMNIFNI